MRQIDNYEEFCNSFSKDSVLSYEAELLLYIQDRMIRIEYKAGSESGEYCLDGFIEDNIDKVLPTQTKKDLISRLSESCIEAVRSIADNMRENIIRENVKTPVYKVKEINGYGLQWLSRRPGTTIKEKISNSDYKMMAVQRRMSLDTGENRLFIAFLKELTERIEAKEEKMPQKYQGEEETENYSRMLYILRDPELDEIGRWENLPPNNTLLSDKYYKVIWRCWNELKQLDDRIKALSSNTDKCLCTLFYYDLVVKLSGSFRVCQLPLTIDLNEFCIQNVTEPLICMDMKGNVLKLTRSDTVISICYLGKTAELSFLEDKLKIEINGSRVIEASISREFIEKHIIQLLKMLNIDPYLHAFEHLAVQPEKIKNLIIDPFSVRPKYIGQDGGVLEMDGRLLYQRQTQRNVPCDRSNMIMLNDLTESFTVTTAIENGNGDRISQLIRLLDKYFSADELTFVFPDIYNEFQLSLIRKSARLICRQVHSFPRSIGVAFSFMLTPDFEKNFQSGDFLLIADLDKDVLSFTLVQGIFDPEAAADMPEYKGVIWERHPCITYTLKKDSDKIKDILKNHCCKVGDKVYELLGRDGVQSERERLAFASDEQDAFLLTSSISDEIKSLKTDISDTVIKFLKKYRSVIRNSNVTILSMSEQLSYNGDGVFKYTDIRNTLTGCKLCGGLSARTNRVLWRDHLPELAIKQLYGKFSLISNETVTPEFNVEKKLPIRNTFTLIKGMPSYHFELVQSDANSKVNYAAVVKHPAFPLKEDVECRLDMTYRYGAEEPYKLLFIPVNNNAPFIEAKVSWERIEEYPYDSLPVPSFIPYEGWSRMRQYPGKDGPQDLIDEFKKRLNAIRKGYRCVDLSRCEVTAKGSGDDRKLILQDNYNGEPATVVFSQKNIEKNEGKNNNNTLNFEQLGVVSYELHESARQDAKKRYTVDLKDYIWNNNGKGYACRPIISIDGNVSTVAFFEDNFAQNEKFSTKITKLSFEVIPHKDGYIAINIHDESKGAYSPQKVYLANNITENYNDDFDSFDSYSSSVFGKLFGRGREIITEYKNNKVDIDLSRCELEYDKDYQAYVLKETYKGEPSVILFSEYVNRLRFSNSGVISCKLEDVTNKFSKQRYRVDLKDCIWNNNGKGYACRPNILIDGSVSAIAFFENNFAQNEKFSTTITKVSFEIIPYKDGYKAINIHDESKGAYSTQKAYFAVNIRSGNSPSNYLYNNKFHFLLITLFTGKKHISDIDCPSELKDLFYSSINDWMTLFDNCDDDWKRMRIFDLLSLVASDLGEKYYERAHQYIEKYKSRGMNFLTNYIGYALDSGESNLQQDLLNDILSLNKEKVVCILSKGLWGNEDLINNIPIPTTLEYFDNAIDYLDNLIYFEKDKKKAIDITLCLEYVLAVFRLRSLNDEGLNKRLSLNNEKVKKLYKYVEKIIEKKIEIRSQLSLDIKNKGIYEEVPDILYALLLFITGDKGAGDIKITGLKLDDLTK